MSADHASQKLLEWLDDPEVSYRVRAEIARGGLGKDPLTRTRAKLGRMPPSVEGASDEPHVGKQHVVSRVLAAQSG